MKMSKTNRILWVFFVLLFSPILIVIFGFYGILYLIEQDDENDRRLCD